MDDTQKSIHELFDRLHDIAGSDIYIAPQDTSEGRTKYITPAIASLLIENDRRLYEKIDILESWIKAEVKQVKQRADRLMPPLY